MNLWTIGYFNLLQLNYVDFIKNSNKIRFTYLWYFRFIHFVFHLFVSHGWYLIIWRCLSIAKICWFPTSHNPFNIWFNFFFIIILILNYHEIFTLVLILYWLRKNTGLVITGFMFCLVLVLIKSWKVQSEGKKKWVIQHEIWLSISYFFHLSFCSWMAWYYKISTGVWPVLFVECTVHEGHTTKHSVSYITSYYLVLMYDTDLSWE